MLECLICNSYLIEAFQHLKHQYLVCRRCFNRAVCQYRNNAFSRLSMLGRLIPRPVARLQKRLVKFKQQQEIQGDDIFILDIFQLYAAARTHTLELSNDYSVDVEEEAKAKLPIDYYQKYNWLREKLQEHYNHLGQSNKYTKLAQTLKNNVVGGTELVLEKACKFRRQLHNLKKEAPSIKELKLGSFLKDKYSKFF